jgi:hypothetical protein
VNVTVEQATQQGGGLPGFDAPAIAGALAVAAAVAVVARRRKDD